MEEEEDRKPAAKDRAMLQQKTNLQGQRISTLETILVAEKGCKKNEVWDENQSQHCGGTGTSAQEAIIINSQSPVANKNKDRAIGYKRRADVYLPKEQIRDVLRRAVSYTHLTLSTIYSV